MTADLCNETWTKSKVWPESTSHGSPIRMVDLFCGCGGLTLGAFEAARRNGRSIEIALAVDLDAKAIGIYRSNFKVDSRIAKEKSVTDLFAGRLTAAFSPAENDLMKECGRIDLIVAGPPCQGHSDLNNSSRRLDPRNSLYLRVIRAAQLFRPKAVVIENVPAVVHDKGRVVSRATNALEAIGYKVSGGFIDAHHVGLAQTRRRHILVAVKNSDFDFAFLASLKPTKAKTVQDFIGDLVALNGTRLPIYDFASNMSAKNKARARFLYRNRKYDLPNSLRPKCHQSNHSYISMYGRLRWNKPAQTITSGFGSMGQGRFLHPSQRRTLTPHEAARLQGFPDFFDFSSLTYRTALQTVIGNAVPPKLAAVFIDRFLECGQL